MTTEIVLPSLDSSFTVALLVAADPHTAPAAAWALARAAATERQVALIDLTLGEGTLDAGADDVGTGGIVDVFEFGASWSHVARPQSNPSLFFVPGGTPATDPHAIWGHARWDKLRRGFQQQGALLLLYVPAKALADLAPRADVVVALGDGPAVATAQAYAAGRNLPLLGPIRLEATPADPDDPSDQPSNTPVAAGRWIPWVVGTVAAVAVFGAALVLLRPDTTPPTVGETAPVPAPPEIPPVPVPEAEAVPGTDRVAPTAIVPLRAADTLYYAVQVAAFSQLPPAMSLAGQLERAGHVVAVTPVHIGARSVLWYRVLVGARETAADAAQTRSALWSAGLLERGQGTVLRVPHAWAFDLTGAGDPGALLAGLRRSGIPAYIVSGTNNPTLYLGAFETPEQAQAAEALLAAAGRPHTLVARSGPTR